MPWVLHCPKGPYATVYTPASHCHPNPLKLVHLEHLILHLIPACRRGWPKAHTRVIPMTTSVTAHPKRKLISSDRHFQAHTTLFNPI